VNPFQSDFDQKSNPPRVDLVLFFMPCLSAAVNEDPEGAENSPCGGLPTEVARVSNISRSVAGVDNSHRLGFELCWICQYANRSHLSSWLSAYQPQGSFR
jgi:hypothetical protein